jgi:hypothetical protein
MIKNMSRKIVKINPAFSISYDILENRLIPALIRNDIDVLVVYFNLSKLLEDTNKTYWKDYPNIISYISSIRFSAEFKLNTGRRSLTATCEFKNTKSDKVQIFSTEKTEIIDKEELPYIYCNMDSILVKSISKKIKMAKKFGGFISGNGEHTGDFLVCWDSPKLWGHTAFMPINPIIHLRKEKYKTNSLLLKYEEGLEHKLNNLSNRIAGFLASNRRLRSTFGIILKDPDFSKEEKQWIESYLKLHEVPWELKLKIVEEDFKNPLATEAIFKNEKKR